jgi:transposase
MRPYSQDLRDRIRQALEAGNASQPAIAARFCVRLSFVEKLWQRFRRSGSSAAHPHAGGRRRALTEHTTLLRREVAHQPDATLEAWRERIAAAQGPQVSTATICRALPRLKLPVKKVAPRRGARHGGRPDVAHRLPRDRPQSRRPPAEIGG